MSYKIDDSSYLSHVSVVHIVLHMSVVDPCPHGTHS